MSSIQYLPALTFSQAAAAVAACLRANRACGLVSGPGRGKSSLWAQAAEAVGLPCVVLVASNYDVTDFAGLPIVTQGRAGKDSHVSRSLFPEIARATEEPVVLVFDDATMVPKSVEGPMLRITLERNAGGAALHPGTRVGLAYNPPEQAPGGLAFSAALVNRLIQIQLASSLTEVAAYFRGEPTRASASTLSEEKFKAARKTEFSEFSATLEVQPNLIQFDPPQASIDSGEPFASPRAWEIGLDAFAAHGGVEDDVGRALLAGVVGRTSADAYLGIRKLREHLPSVEQVLSKPDTAKVPAQEDHQIASLGLIARVAETDSWAAWVYASRLASEFAAASARYLISTTPPKSSPVALKGREAMTGLLARIRTQGGAR